jgi:ATP-dependent DNA helicase RecQ
VKKATRVRGAGGVKRSAPVEELAGEAVERFEQLKAWRTEQARPTRTPAFMILSDAVLRGIAAAGPRTLAELHSISGMGPAKVERFGAGVLAACRGESVAGSGEKQNAKEEREGREGGRAGFGEKLNAEGAGERRGGRGEIGAGVGEKRVVFGSGKTNTTVPQLQASALQKRAVPALAEIPVEFSVEQKEMEARLRAWRGEQARALGLPSFFILSDTALRGIVAAGPRSLGELRGVHGVGTEQLTKYGEAVLAVCRA